MAAITLQDLKPLLEQFVGKGMVLSFYADLGVSEGFRPDWRALFKARTDGIEKVVRGDEGEQQEYEANVAAIHRAMEDPRMHTAHWVAVFSAAQRKFLQAMPLDVPVETDLVIDRSPYLVPLLEVMARRKEYLVVYTDTHCGRIYDATPGEVRLLTSIEEAVPRKQHSAGERWGYGQATIARHRENEILHYRKELSGELERLWDTGQFAGLVLLGEHEVLENLRPELPKRLRIVREAAEAGYEESSRAERRIRELVTDLYSEELVGVGPDFWDRLREGKAVATGPRAVIDAVQKGRIAPEGHGYLVFGPDPRGTVGRCIACRSLAVDVMGACPKCQAPCAPGNLWEELLLTALQHHFAVHFVKDPRKLEPYGGVVAMLAKGTEGRG